MGGEGEMKECKHCWHLHQGALNMVLKDGFVPEQCCGCGEVRQVHADHRGETP